MSSKFTKEFLEEEYVIKEKSPAIIAEENHTYPNSVRRSLIKLGFKLRDHSEAQTVAIIQGRTEHPTRGKRLSENHKKAIAESIKIFNEVI